MSDEDGYDRDVAKWLEETGHRVALHAPESAEELLRYLQSCVGQRLSSRADIDCYLSTLKVQQAERIDTERKQRILRETALLLALLLAVGVNHYLDVRLQIASLPQMLVFL